MLLPAVMAHLEVRDTRGELPPLAVTVICTLMSAAMGAWGLWMGRKRILVEERGLCWRGLGREQKARWEEIDDYFITTDQQGFRTNFVTLADGRVLKFDRHFANFRRLEITIARRATNAKPSGWLIRSKAGTVTDKLVCTYTEKQRRNIFAQVIILPVFFCLIGLALPLLPDENGHHLGWVWASFGLIPATIFGLFAYTTCREHERRQGERFEADEHGFAFFSPDGSATLVPWPEVRNLRFSSAGLVPKWILETREAAFPIFSTLENHQMLLSLARNHCEFLVLTRRLTRDSLIPTEKTDGKRTFHYRTRSNRVLLGVLLALTIFPLWIASGLIQTDHRYPDSDMPPSPIWLPLTMAALLVLWWSGALWRYKVRRLILDAEGVIQVNLFGQVRVGYEEITRLIGESENYYLETAEGYRPIRWGANIADAHALREELEARTGLRIRTDSLAELVEKVQNPAEETDQVQ
jgi:hypothetical protein